MADLDPRTALAYAKRMKEYIEAFDGRDWANVMIHGSPDEQNLAHALDNLTECAAMLMNMADRVASQRELLDAAKAVVARWDTPSWKDVGPTADYINRLRNAVDTYGVVGGEVKR